VTELYPYQVTGARYLAEHRKAMLLDEPGLGKTVQAIEACNLVGARDVLVICPASVVSNWRREFARFGTGQRVRITSYDLVARDWRAFADLYDALILDEAHYLKAPNAKRTLAVYGNANVPGLANMVPHVFALTGTPAPNHAGEVWTHFNALHPEGLAKPAYPDRRLNFDEFVSRFCKFKPGEWGPKVVGSRNLEELRERLAGFTLRRLKKDVLPDLPDISYQELAIDAADAARRIESDVDETELALVKTALQSGDSDALMGLAAHLPGLRRLTAMAKVDALIAWVREFHEAAPDRKIVIFGHHTEPLERLQAGLRNEVAFDPGRMRPVLVMGSTPPGHRGNMVEKFQKDPKCRVFIGQITAAGTGITLTAASDLIFLEQSWVPSDNSQAAQRIHRIGQKRGCMVRYCTLAGSIDEAVQRVLARKTKDLAALLD